MLVILLLAAVLFGSALAVPAPVLAPRGVTRLALRETPRRPVGRQRREEPGDRDQWRLEREPVEALLSLWDVMYTVEVLVGTPPQAFEVEVDTGSGDFWVLNKCSNATECGQSTLFDEAASSSFTSTDQTYSIRYMLGETQGYWGQDVVSVAGLQAETMFGVANKATNWQTPASGILGFSFAKGGTGYKPWWQHVSQSWQEPLFALHLERGKAVEHNDHFRANAPQKGVGQLSLGGTDKSKFTGDINYVPLTNDRRGLWTIGMNKVYVNGKSVSAVSHNAVIDSGTTYISAPRYDAARFYGWIPGSRKITDTLYIYPASTPIDVAFDLNGITYHLSKEDLMRNGRTYTTKEVEAKAGVKLDSPPDMSWIVGAVSSEETDAWFIGMAFMKNVYTVFRYDPPAVGFASLASS